MTIIINKYIIADSAICHGKPTFKGTRIMVWQILEMLAGGETVAELLRDYPALTKKHIEAALNYAARMTERGSIQITANKFNEIPC